jgi:hypothetical protein
VGQILLHRSTADPTPRFCDPFFDVNWLYVVSSASYIVTFLLLVVRSKSSAYDGDILLQQAGRATVQRAQFAVFMAQDGVACPRTKHTVVIAHTSYCSSSCRCGLDHGRQARVNTG